MNSKANNADTEEEDSDRQFEERKTTMEMQQEVLKARRYISIDKLSSYTDYQMANFHLFSLFLYSQSLKDILPMLKESTSVEGKFKSLAEEPSIAALFVHLRRIRHIVMLGEDLVLAKDTFLLALKEIIHRCIEIMQLVTRTLSECQKIPDNDPFYRLDSGPRTRVQERAYLIYECFSTISCIICDVFGRLEEGRLEHLTSELPSFLSTCFIDKPEQSLDAEAKNISASQETGSSSHETISACEHTVDASEQNISASGQTVRASYETVDASDNDAAFLSHGQSMILRLRKATLRMAENLFKASTQMVRHVHWPIIFDCLNNLHDLQIQESFITYMLLAPKTVEYFDDPRFLPFDISNDKIFQNRYFARQFLKPSYPRHLSSIQLYPPRQRDMELLEKNPLFSVLIKKTFEAICAQSQVSWRNQNGLPGLKAEQLEQVDIVFTTDGLMDRCFYGFSGILDFYLAQATK